MFAIVAGDEAELFVNRSDGVVARTGGAEGASDAYLRVAAIDLPAAEPRTRGADIVEGPEDQVYGQRELVVRDCDGLVLAFGEAIHPLVT